MSKVARAFLLDIVCSANWQTAREEIKSQLISVSKAKIRFDLLEDRTSILSKTYDMVDTWDQAVQSPRCLERGFKG